MSDLSCAYKIFPLPINCDTLLLTFSPHHQVIHRHAHHLEQIYSLIYPHQQTHRLVLISDSYQQGKEAIAALEQSKLKATLPEKLPERISLSPKYDPSPNLIQQMIIAFEKKKQRLEIKSAINKKKEENCSMNPKYEFNREWAEPKTPKITKRIRKQLKIYQKAMSRDLQSSKKEELARGGDSISWKQQLNGEDLSWLQQLEQEEELLEKDLLNEKQNNY